MNSRAVRLVPISLPARARAAALEAAAGRAVIQLPVELTQGFEREVRFSMRAMPSPHERAADVTREVAQRFAEVAGDPRAFHDLMRAVFGSGYDQLKAEGYRQAALRGDFTWLPPVRFVDSATLGGANGAYDTQANVVFINASLLADPGTAAQVYAHELGHFFDGRLNRADSVGDEGELFRLLLGGEKVTADQLAAIRADNATGAIVIDGRSVEVEFWNPAKAVSKAVSGAAKAVGKAVSSVGKGAASVLAGAAHAGGNFFTGLGHGLRGFGRGLLRARLGDAFSSLWDGTVVNALKSGRVIVAALFESTQYLLDAPTYLVGRLGRPWRRLNARLVGGLEAIGLGALDATVGFAKGIGDASAGLMRGFDRLVRGDVAGAWKEWQAAARQFLRAPVDAGFIALAKALSGIQTILGLEKPGRKLTSEEIASLRAIYGDSIDYTQVEVKEGSAGLFSASNRPFVLGNTIYLKGKDDLATLVHEMCHVWQYQNGGNEYALDSLLDQARRGDDAYNWRRSVPATPWQDLGPEQQAAFIEAAYRAGCFNPHSGNYGRFAADLDGDGRAEDLTAYLRRAVAAVRAG